MRTTLTLDDDIAVQLAQLREERRMSLRDAVNTAMRMGLTRMINSAHARKKIFKTPVFHATRVLIGDTTNTSEMLAVAEGEGYR
ncbi:MAG: hypothetical protein ACOYOU_02460 [Kiritimatiellia bacterium]